MEITRKACKGFYPILLVENLHENFGQKDNNINNFDNSISKEEEILLTLIAEIIVEIILYEEL